MLSGDVFIYIFRDFLSYKFGGRVLYKHRCNAVHKHVLFYFCDFFYLHFYRDFFKIFRRIFLQFWRRHIFVHLTTSSFFFYKKSLFEPLSTPYQLCSGNKMFWIFDFFFLEKKDNLVEIHFGHLFLSILKKLRVVLFLGFCSWKKKFLFLLGFQKCKKKSPYNFVERNIPKTQGASFLPFFRPFL